MVYFVYILRSKSHKKYYTGHTNNLIKRIHQHNSGKTRSIKAYIPFELVYFEQYFSRNEAVAREKFLKSGAGREWTKEILKIASLPAGKAGVVQLDTA